MNKVRAKSLTELIDMDAGYLLSTLGENWLNLALTHVVTQWLKLKLQDLLPLLIAGDISSEAFAADIDAVLQSRNLVTLSQQKNPRSNVAQALKSIDPNHPAIALVSLAPDEYRLLNDAQLSKLGDTQPKYITSEIAQTVVDRATDLLSSAEWSDVSAGLAVLVGRRISEILLSDFAPKSAYSILFSGMAKKSSAEAAITIEIPTLAPANSVLAAIDKLQTGLKIEGLKLQSLSEKQAKQTVNRRYSEASADACDRHFADLVPLRQDKERLYNHLFRALYATIAAHWYCPSTVLEHNYKAEIQGHFTISADGKKVPNYSARSHYDDYLIGYFDTKCQTWQRDGRLGIKLQVEGVQVIEAFRDCALSTTKGDRTSFATDVSDCSHPVAAVAASIELPAKAERSIDNTLSELESENRGDLDMTKIQQKPQPKPRRKTSSQSQRRSATKTQQQLATTADEPLATTVTPDQASDPSTLKQQPQASTLDKKPQSNHPALEADDLVRMRRLMAQFGVVGSSNEVFSALLDRFEQLQQQKQQPTSTPNPDLETIRWFTREIDSLRSQVAALELERDRLKSPPVQVEEIARLQAENAQLHAQLQQNQAVLDSLRDSLAQVGLIGAGEAFASPKSAAAMPSSDTQQTTIFVAPASANGSGATADGAITSASSPSTPSKPAKKTRSGAEQTAAKIHQILDALIAWNADHTHPHQRIRIGVLPVKALASKMGADHQAQIQAALQQRSEEIEQMHQRLMLGSKHNRSLFNKDEVLQAIARDLLHLVNWQDVRYPG